jgi:hypothetical protein
LIDDASCDFFRVMMTTIVEDSDTLSTIDIVGIIIGSFLGKLFLMIEM